MYFHSYNDDDITVLSCVTVWEEWTRWESCSVTCGGGTRSRTRGCQIGPCYGPSGENKQCNLQECPGTNKLNIILT